MHRHYRKLFAVLVMVMLISALAVPVFAESAELVACPDCEAAGLIECATCEGAGEIEPPYESNMYGTFWALIPPVVAIVLALITKEVFSSLFVGIVLGGLFYSNFSPIMTLNTVLNDGFIGAIADPWNAGIFMFLVLLGILVALMNQSGGSRAFGTWAEQNVKSRVGAMLATFALGVLIFVDDYFNCLTVGSVMRPLSDSHRVSRAKFAYLIDATAAPICMIAPISSWAAAVSGMVPEESMNSMELFVRAIPYNFYSLLTFVFILSIVLFKVDYGPMKIHEMNAQLHGKLGAIEGENETPEGAKGKLIDLVFPVVMLIGLCVLGMIYVGGFFDGESFVDSFANTDASVGLPWGALVAVVITIAYLVCRRVINFKDAMACCTKGFIAMVPAILILTFALSLKNMTGMLGADAFVEAAMYDAAPGLANFLPAIIFLVACLLAFSTGTSWGTFGILIPVVVKMFPVDSELLIIGVAACLAGAVCGDHCSPISDTTIMSSAGAQCDHVEHVSTQLPYAITVAVISFICYLLAGIVQNAFICLALGAVLVVGLIFAIRMMNRNSQVG